MAISPVATFFLCSGLLFLKIRQGTVSRDFRTRFEDLMPLQKERCEVFTRFLQKAPGLVPARWPQVRILNSKPFLNIFWKVPTANILKQISTARLILVGRKPVWEVPRVLSKSSKVPKWRFEFLERIFDEEITSFLSQTVWELWQLF